MAEDISAAQWCAVQTLQGMRDRRNPNSFEFEIIDYAIDLALSPNRALNQFLIKNVLRDARTPIE